MLNLRTLAENDRPAGLVQCFSFLASIVVVSGIAARLGAGRRGQMVAAAFAASLPLAVLTASNTKNDLVVGLWALCLAYLVVSDGRGPLTRPDLAAAGGALGLGLLTKGTFQPVAFPFLLWLGLRRWRQLGAREALRGLLLVGGTAILLNLGFWARNIVAFGYPYGPIEGLVNSLEVDSVVPPVSALPDDAGAVGFSEPRPDGESTPRTWPFASRLFSLLTLHTMYPIIGQPVRARLADLGWAYEPGFLASLDEGLWNHEDSAGNLLHLILAMAASAWILARSVVSRKRVAAWFVLAVWVGWAGLALITNSTQLWGIRYQLSSLMLWGSAVGVATMWIPKRGLVMGGAFGLLATSVPYLLFNNTRPLVGDRPRTRSASIFQMSQEDLLFVSTPEIEGQYVLAARTLSRSTCRDVGLDLRNRDLEYSFWWLLNAPQSGFRLEATGSDLVGRGATGPSDFVPCAELCTTCSGRNDVLGLPLAYDGGYVRLYLSDPETRDPPRPVSDRAANSIRRLW